MQNFTAEKWADKIALFIDNFGFLSGFFWHWTIALPSPTSHLAMLHSKIILSDPNRRVKVVLIGFSLFWSRCRTWGTAKSLFRSVKFLFLPALFWVAFFCKFSNQDFLLFHNGIITLHCLGRWQIYRRGYFSFQNSSMTKNDSTV